MTDEGPTVLALHGQPGTGHDFTAVVRALDGRSRVLAPDRPGWGARAGEPARGFAAGADDAAAILDRHGVGRVVVLGFSWGGGVALELARRHPDRVGALVLAASVGPGEPTPADRMLALPVAGRAISGVGLACTRLALRRPALHGLVAGGMQGVDVDHLRRFADDCLTRSALDSFMVEQRALVREFPAVLAALGGLRVPTIVVSGDRDRMVSPRSSRRLADRIPGSELRLVPGAGHYLPGARPAVLAEAVIEAATRAAW